MSAAVAPLLLSGKDSLARADTPAPLPMLDGEHLPFSSFGSYWAISKRWDFGATAQIPAGEWYIRLLEDDVTPNELFQISLYNRGGKLSFTPRLTPADLTLFVDSGTFVQFVVAAPDVLRLRGRGCSLRLNGIKGAYGYAVPSTPGSWEFLAAVDMPRVQLRALSGALTVEAPWADQLHSASCASVQMELSPDQTGNFEALLHYYDGTPRRDIASGSFDSCVRSVEAAFHTWTDHLPKLQSQVDAGRLVAAYVLWSSTVGPRGLYKQPVVWCSKSWMNRIWSWDHCFVAVGLAPSFATLSWQQFSLFEDMQDSNSGVLADWFSNVRRSWLCTKPPIHGWALMHLLQTMPVTHPQLEQIYEPLRKWTQFWLTDRNLDADGLPCILNPNESFDNTSANTLFGPVKAPEIAAYLALQMEALGLVAGKLGHDLDARQWHARSKQTIDTLLRELWNQDKGCFLARRVPDGKTGDGDCIFSFVPLVLGRRLPSKIAQSMAGSLAEPGRFLTPYGFATEALSSPHYNGNSYVKGPVWAPPCVFIAEGLHDIGATGLASRVRKGFLQNCLQQGMSEHFDAKTGAAQGDPGYNWTAAMFLHFARLEGLQL